MRKNAQQERSADEAPATRGSIGDSGLDTSRVMKLQRNAGNSAVTDLLRGPFSPLQRDLAVEPRGDTSESVELTPDQTRRAIAYNRASYSADSCRQIQDVVGAEQTGTFDEVTVRLIAQYQHDYGLGRHDGKVGHATFERLTRELTAAGGEDVGPEAGPGLILFQIVGPLPLRFFRNSPTTGTIGSRFDIRAQFDPRARPGDFEYRQYIAGNIRWVSADDVRTRSMNHVFRVPGGLTQSLTEDGNLDVSAGVSGRRYGHRRDADNPGTDNDEYVPDRRTGDRYEGYDVPEMTGVPAGPNNTGEVYEWDMRFRGVILRQGRVIEEKYWNISDVIAIPEP